MRTISAELADCEAHGYHRPEPAWLELHHVIPQSWQLVLWGRVADKRVLALCRTGHGNVHWDIVRLMKRQTGLRRGADLQIARMALERVEEAEPGSVGRLIASRNWGGMGGS